MLIIRRIDKDIIKNNILLNSIKLIIKISFIMVDLGVILRKIMLKLLISEKFIEDIQRIRVILIVNIILLEGEKNIGIKFIKFINIIILMIILNKILFDLFLNIINKFIFLFSFQNFLFTIIIIIIKIKFKGINLILGSNIVNILFIIFFINFFFINFNIFYFN